MKVFISWSGELSHKVATVFRDWLPSVIQTIEPYVSSEDIDKGARWSTDIAKELEDSSFGILCITKKNVNAPWLNFEAGALSKSIDKSKVIPFLFGVKRSEIKGPTLQFQSTIHEKDDIKKLLCSLNKACGPSCLDESRLDKIYDVWWPRLDKNLNAIQDNPPEILESEQRKAKNDSANSSILEEILELVRNQQKLLNSPETILPSDYLQHILRSRPGSERGLKELNFAFEDLGRLYIHILEILKEMPTRKPVPFAAYSKLRRNIFLFSKPIKYILTRTEIDFPLELNHRMKLLLDEIEKL